MALLSTEQEGVVAMKNYNTIQGGKNTTERADKYWGNNAIYKIYEYQLKLSELLPLQNIGWVPIILPTSSDPRSLSPSVLINKELTPRS